MRAIRQWAVGAMLVVTTGALALAPGTHAADPPTLSLSVQNDLEQTAIVVRATGTVDPSGTVAAYAQPAGSCTPAASGTLIGSRAVAGSFTEDLSGGFTPSDQGSHQACGYIDGVLVGQGVALTVRPPAFALTMSSDPATLSFSGVPTWIEGGGGTVSLSNGSVEGGLQRTLEIFSRAETSCPGAPDAASRRAGVAMGPAASFSGPQPFEVMGTTSRLCAYLYDGAAVERVVTASVPSARAPQTRNIAMDVPSGVVAEVPFDLPYSGEVEVPRRVMIYARRGGTICPANGGLMSDQAGTDALMDRPLPSQFSGTHTVTLPVAGSYLICMYVGRDTGSTPDVIRSRTVTARVPTGSVAVSAPAIATPGEVVELRTSGTSEDASRLFVALGPDRTCLTTAAAELGRPGVSSLTGAGGYAAGPGAYSHTAVVIAGSAALKACAYLADTVEAGPKAVGSALMSPPAAPPPPPPPPPPPGPTPPGGTPPDLDVDPGPIPATIGKAGTSGFYVNDQVVPPGVSGERLVTLARRSGERWGFRFLGLTTGGAAKQDGHPTVGFSSRIPAAKVSGIVTFKTRERPKGCSSRSTSRKCRARARTVERDLALSRRLTAWWTEPGHPPADRVDLETALLRAFGQLAGNRASAAPCAGSPLIASVSARGGWWWRSPADAFHPECGG